MQKIVYAEHLKMRLELRELAYDLPAQIFKRSAERYRDRETGLSIAIGRSAYRGKMREFAVVYREAGNMITLITIHPVKLRQKLARVRAGRWKPLL